MIVVASENGKAGIRQAMQVLRDGGSALDAVETGIRLVELVESDHSVGLGGYPNILGQVEQDASIMDGRTLLAGAVGALHGCRHPISVARKVMETLPHVLLVGAGADRFAAEMGFEHTDWQSPEATAWRQEHLAAIIPPEILADLAAQPDLARWVQRASDPRRAKGTTNMIAVDTHGDIACGVSTSGWAVKYPGRLGDSPIIGAGNYADNRYGAAACTGLGELAIRAATARSVVLYLKMGLPLAEAGRLALQEINELPGPYLSDMNIVAVDSAGNPAGFSNNPKASYIYMRPEMADPLEETPLILPITRRWPVID